MRTVIPGPSVLFAIATDPLCASSTIRLERAKEKIENRAGRSNLGFLICVEQFADTITFEMVRSSKSDLLIVPVDGERLERLVLGPDRSALLVEFLTKATLV